MISLSITAIIVLAVSALTFFTLLKPALRSVRDFCSNTGDLGRAYQRHFPKCSEEAHAWVETQRAKKRAQET